MSIGRGKAPAAKRRRATGAFEDPAKILSDSDSDSDSETGSGTESCESLSSSNSELSESGSEVDSGSDAGSDVEFSFGCYNMDKEDYHAIKQFMMNAFGRGVEGSKGGLCGKVDVTALAHTIVDVLGEYVGSTAKSSEKEDPLAFTTMVPLRLNDFSSELSEEGFACAKELLAMLRETAHKTRNLDKQAKCRVEKALQEYEYTALVLHERFMNLPAEIAVPLYQQLLDDLPAAVEESRSFEPKHILLLTPIFRELESKMEVEWDKKKGGKKGPRAQQPEPEPELDAETESADARVEVGLDSEQRVDKSGTAAGAFQYYYAESELLEGLAQASWDFRIRTPHETSDSRRAFGDRGVDPARRVFLLTMEDFRLFVKQCAAFLP